MTVFLDTAIFMYGAGADHPLREPCRRILGSVAARRLDATTSAEVVQEVLHRFAAIGRHELGVAMARDILDGFAPVLPISDPVIRRVPDLMERYRTLAARDLIHVATCLQEGITTIVSPDRGFDLVHGIERRDPSAL